MIDDTEQPLVSWAAVRDRIFRFAPNILTFERTLDRVARAQATDHQLLKELDERVSKIEAQQEIIIRLMEKRS